MTLPNTFSGARIDRAGPQRADPAWVAARIADPDSRALLLTPHGVYLEGDDGAPPRLARAPLAAVVASASTAGVLLGVEGDGRALFALESAVAPDGARLAGVRDAAAGLDPHDAGLVAYAAGMLNWHRRHGFCANCGAPTVAGEAGFVRVCPSCGAHHHPRTDPVVIMLVVDPDGDRLLLGRQAAWPPGRYSALAGFVEPGEPLESAVVREVAEEAGVAGGLGRHFDVDPVVFRITLAALAFVGGAGLFIYVAALLFVPAEGEDRAPFTRSRVLKGAGIGILALLGIALLADVTGGGAFGLVPLAVLAGVGYAVFRAVRRDPQDDRPVTVGRVTAWVAAGAGALLVAAALAVASAYAAAEGSGAVVAGVVIAIGALLAASALRGRGARWLAVPALVIAVPLGIVSAADVRFEGGYGEKEYRPATVADLPRGGYELAAGELRLDLRDVEFPAGRETVVPVAIGMGYAEVVLPRGVCAVTDSRFGGGFMSLRGREAAGLDVDFLVRGDGGRAPRVRIDGDVGLGAIEVVDRPGEEPFDRGPDGRTGPGRVRGYGADLGDEPTDDGACTRVEIASAE